MLNRLLNKIFNKDRESRKPTKDESSKPESGDHVAVPNAPPRPRDESVAQDAGRNMDIPNRLEKGTVLKVVPESLQGKPRAWDMEITRLDIDGIWIASIKSDSEPIPTEKGKFLSLVLMGGETTTTYDCPLIRIEDNGSRQELLVAPPTKTLQEASQVQNKGGRQHLRIDFRLPAEIRRAQGTELGPPISAHTKDISMSGLAFESSSTFESGEEIDIRILSWNFPLQVRAFVIRCFPSDGKNTIAVTFPPDLSTVPSDQITQFIVENQRR